MSTRTLAMVQASVCWVGPGKWGGSKSKKQVCANRIFEIIILNPNMISISLFKILFIYF